MSILSSGFAPAAQAQAARSPQGTLIIKVPRGLLPSGDYWIYVDREIVSGPPHGDFASLAGDFIHIGADVPSGWLKEHYRDAVGLAVASEGGRLTYVRPGLSERIFAPGTPIQLAPGKHVVELVTRAAEASFPFAVARVETVVIAGGTEEIAFGVPTGTSEVTIVRASRCGTCGLSGHSPEQTLKFIQDDFDRTRREFDLLPMVAVLNSALLDLPIDPALRPTVFARLPAGVGGGRDLDARQIDLIVRDLAMHYTFPSLEGSVVFRNAAPPVPELVAFLELKIGEHNRRILRYHQVVNALEQAKRR